MKICGAHRINLTAVLMKNNGITGAKKLTPKDIAQEKTKDIAAILKDRAAQQATKVALDTQYSKIEKAVKQKEDYYNDNALISRVTKLFHKVTFNILNPVKWSKHTKNKIDSQKKNIESNITELEKLLPEKAKEEIKKRLNSDSDLANLAGNFTNPEDFKDILQNVIINKMKDPSDIGIIGDAIKNLKKNLPKLQAEINSKIKIGNNANNNGAFARFLIETDLSSENEYAIKGFLPSILKASNDVNIFEIYGDNDEKRDFISFKTDYTKILDLVKESSALKDLTEYLKSPNEDKLTSEDQNKINRLLAMMICIDLTEEMSAATEKALKNAVDNLQKNFPEKPKIELSDTLAQNGKFILFSTLKNMNLTEYVVKGKGLPEYKIA